MIQLCSQCHSLQDFEVFDSCSKCGAINYPEWYKPYDVVSVYDNQTDGIRQRKSYNNNRRGICRNCLREMALHCGDLCGYCYKKVQAYPPGPEREAKLKEIRMKKWPHRFRE